MNTTDIMMLIGLGSVFLLIVYGGAKTAHVIDDTPRGDAQGCQQGFNTIVAAIGLLILLAVLTSVLH